MKLTIIIPVYNEASRLGACLDSIDAQNIKAHEVIIVDNNSSDASFTVARKYRFVTVVNESQQGIVHARNKGFNAANGDIIGRIDADTILPADWTSQILNFYANQNNHKYGYSGGATFHNVRIPRAVSWLYNVLAFDFNHLLIGHPTLWGSNMAITKKQWQAVSRDVHSLNGIHEDLDLAMHLRSAGYKIYYDRKNKISANLRSVRTNRHELWDYLQWWPRTLRLHGKKTWVICWLVGCAMLYVVTPALSIAEFIARKFGKTALPD